MVRTRPKHHGRNLLPNPWSINDIFGLRDVPLQILIITQRLIVTLNNVHLICIVLRMMGKLEIPFSYVMLPCARRIQLKHAQVFSKLLLILCSTKSQMVA